MPVTSRRRVLNALVAVAGLLRAKLGYGARLGSGDAPITAPAALEAWLDTLIPADVTPSATQLGVHRRVLADFSRPYSRELLERGCAWLDSEARKTGKSGFGALTQIERDTIAGRAAAAPPGSGPREFFDRTRDAAMRLYYAEPAAWPSLGYGGPPQPRGFPDRTHPPAPSR